MKWDVFISHASEDKATIARPLSELLTRAGLEVWLDESELTLGDSLSRKIDEGLAHSRYGVVILSKQFFQKRWPPHELAGLAAKQLIGGQKVILPVWHGVDQAFILQYSPPLADAVAANTKDGLESVAAEIVRAVRSSLPSNHAAGSKTTLTPKSKRLILGSSLTMLLLIYFSISLFHRLAPSTTKPPLHNDGDRQLFWRSTHGAISGYFVVSCANCGRPRAWAFYEPPTKEAASAQGSEVPTAMPNTNSRPMREFFYPDDKPSVGWCVDFPKGVCLHEHNDVWNPSHELEKRKGSAPELNLDLRLMISGFELSVSNTGEMLAKDINVDIVAWQTGSPGIEFQRSYHLRDLTPWADFTIQSVFDNPSASEAQERQEPSPKVLQPVQSSTPEEPSRRSKQKRIPDSRPEDSSSEGQSQNPGTPSAATDGIPEQKLPAQPTSENKLIEPISLAPITVGPGKLTKAQAEGVAHEAQSTAAKILNCLVTYTEFEGRTCVSVYGTSVTSVKDELHNYGIEFSELNATVRQLESAPSADVLRHSADVLRAVADKVVQMVPDETKPAPTDESKTVPPEPIPTDISATLPPQIHMRKGRIRSLSKKAGGVAATIDQCIVMEEGYNFSDKYQVGHCLQAITYSLTDDLVGVAEEIQLIRRELGSAGVVVDELEDVVSRIRRGPTKQELRYISRFMDILSQELSKRAR